MSLFNSDGYKIAHHKMLPPGTTLMYGNWTPRSLKHAPKGVERVVSFGQQMVVKQLKDMFDYNFFHVNKQEALAYTEKMFSSYLGMHYDVSHFEKLYDLGYLPLRIKALPEGISTLPNIPHATFVNTHDDFAWLTLYIETLFSALAWKAPTSATIALQYKKLLTKWALQTDKNNVEFVNFQGNDFSARGLDPHNMIASGLGHATSFMGSDTLAVIPASQNLYNWPKDSSPIVSVPASEHSVSSACIAVMGELEMIRYYMKQYPTGILSIVSDTFDLWKLITEYLPQLKDEILARDGKIVIRPDSGDPVDIVCGLNSSNSINAWKSSKDGRYYTDEKMSISYIDNKKEVTEAEYKGVVELLWDIFGGTINEQGYKVLDPHIGCIYGDSITLDRAEQICTRLKSKGFASTNIVFGIGSYTYQMNTRDTFGYAAKGTYCEVDGKGINIYKDPVTDDGMKKSAKGLLRVNLVDDEYVLKQECTWKEEEGGVLQTIFEDGKVSNNESLSVIRKRINTLV